ncbi:MAG: lipase family alpha/beta hydrolase [Gammaproteobacteria bacterium]
MPSDHSSRPPARRLPALLLGALWLPLLSACSLVQLKDESSQFYASTVLVGEVSAPAGWDRPIVVAAATREQGRLKIVHHAVLHEAGGYELIVPKGEYELFAFGDANGNLALDAGEPVGRYSPAPVAASGTGVVIELNVALSNKAQAEIPLGTQVAAKPVAGPSHSTQAGAIADLDAAVFSAQFGKSGYWAPMAFFREAGGNVYFLEPYDPARIPVLFVHGVAGSPQDWRYFFSHLDRTRYQPWFFYYPSGAALDSMAYLLYWKLINLQRRYHFDTLYVTAHSMGGLVVRSLLGNPDFPFPAAKAFISISTPWGGDAMADTGVDYSPAVIPSWRDVRSKGRFIGALFERPLPRELEYTLFFGHGGKYSLLRSANTDGAITLASQLRPAAQAEARLVKGFNEDHVGILSSAEVFRQYERVLAGADKTFHAAAAGKGSVRLAFDYEQADDAPRSAPALLLTPQDKTQQPIALPIQPGDNGSQLGPFPPGQYSASLVAYGFRSTPSQLPVTIAADATPRLAFSLAPQGVFSGYIGAELNASDSLAARAAGSYRAPHRDLHIESITLSSGADTRRLTPADDVQDRTLESYLAGRDYAHQSSFSFVGLAAGEYELTIKARGYQVYRKTYRIVPGQYVYVQPIDLIPLQQ